jgi:hypothetical protein
MPRFRRSTRRYPVEDIHSRCIQPNFKNRLFNHSHIPPLCFYNKLAAWDPCAVSHLSLNSSDSEVSRATILVYWSLVEYRPERINPRIRTDVAEPRERSDRCLSMNVMGFLRQLSQLGSRRLFGFPVTTRIEVCSPALWPTLMVGTSTNARRGVRQGLKGTRFPRNCWPYPAGRQIQFRKLRLLAWR